LLGLEFPPSFIKCPEHDGSIDFDPLIEDQLASEPKGIDATCNRLVSGYPRTRDTKSVILAVAAIVKA